MRPRFSSEISANDRAEFTRSVPGQDELRERRRLPLYSLPAKFSSDEREMGALASFRNVDKNDPIVYPYVSGSAVLLPDDLYMLLAN
ncbi:MAG: hypothetical protein ACLRS8_18325 [Parabacteroides merdae]